MIDLNKIKSRSSITNLENYSGKNPYLKKLKLEFLKSRNVNFTETQVRYINQFHNVEPQLINRIVSLQEFFGLQLQEQLKLEFTPKKILIEFMLADTEKSYHVFGKLTTKQKESKMYWLPKSMVLDDPYFEEINIDVDFAPYEKCLQEKKGFKVLEHQKSGVKFLLSRKKCILGDDMGVTKGEVLTNRLFTPSGRKMMGDIKVGDEVIGSNGKPTKVIGVFPLGKRKIYRVTFSDNYYLDVTDEHFWEVTTANNGINRTIRDYKKYVLDVNQLMDKNLELEVNGVGNNSNKKYKIKTYYKTPSGNNKWQIPIVEPIVFNSKNNLPIDPYLLGLCLGDGHFTKNNNGCRIQVHKDDYDELLGGYNLKEYKEFNNLRTGYINFGNKLNELKLNGTRSHTKFIPDEYKYSSINDRISLLRGLMDTDGHSAGKNNKFKGSKYSTVSEKLCDDLAEVIHSLGGIVKKSVSVGSYKKNGVKIICKKSYLLNIKFNNLNPFKLKRKANLYTNPTKYKVARYIKDIKYIGDEEAQCIKVDAEDNLYTSEHAIVTHNTVTSIMAAIEGGYKKVLVICPASVKINWEREINIFDDNTCIVDGMRWEDNKFTIINYDILRNFHTVGKPNTEEGEKAVRDIVNSNFDLIIIDEAHKIKDKDSVRSQIINDICLNYGDKDVWLLSGTPVANRPMDFYNLLKLIKSSLVENWNFYVKRYCDGKQITTTLKNGKKKKIWITNGASNLEELHARTKNILLRRLKSEVLDMPEKTITNVFHKLDDSSFREYDRIWDEYLLERKALKKRGTVNREMTESLFLRKFIAMQSIPHTIEMVKNAIEQGEKVVVFTTFKDEQKQLEEAFGNICVVHNGDMSNKDKQLSVDAFQNKDKIKVFIGNVISAGVGITLTKGSICIFNSFSWVPGENEQAEDRIYRLGQLNNCKIYYQVFLDTISIKMLESLKRKSNNISKIVGDKEKEKSLETILDEILNDE